MHSILTNNKNQKKDMVESDHLLDQYQYNCIFQISMNSRNFTPAIHPVVKASMIATTSLT